MACGNVRNFGGLAARALDTLGPFQLNQPFAALVIRAELLKDRHQVVNHKVTMEKKQTQKHASKMTNPELAEAVFHPKVLAHAREHIERLNAEAKAPKTPRKKSIQE